MDYYVNNQKQSNGDNEVHRDGCTYMPQSRTYLGNFNSCHSAVAEARRRGYNANGCYYCSRECHTG
jgi:hypothetical protein